MAKQVSEFLLIPLNKDSLSLIDGILADTQSVVINQMKFEVFFYYEPSSCPVTKYYLLCLKNMILTLKSVKHFLNVMPSIVYT
jgi:hypothetical protein